LRNLDQLKLLGSGMTSDVFLYENGTILKLFKAHFGEAAARYEADLSRKISATAIVAPRFVETIRVGDRIGIVSEYVEGELLFSRLLRNPWRSFAEIKKFARVHHQINATTDCRLPSQTERFHSLISKEETLTPYLSRLMQRLKTISTKTSVCHGDFHCGNVIVSEQTYYTIDWMNCYSGNPEGDAVRSYLMLISPFDPLNLPLHRKVFFLAFKRILGRVYLREYLKVAGLKKNQLRPWIPVIAAVRITDNVPNERQWLLKMIRIGFSFDPGA
jgi:uncharacterized protein (TIGR02172 family)